MEGLIRYIRWENTVGLTQWLSSVPLCKFYTVRIRTPLATLSKGFLQGEIPSLISGPEPLARAAVE